MLYLYNYLTRKKEPFKPLKRGQVGLYTCGPTVYNFAHIGNLRTYVFEDVLRRTLEYSGYRVRHVMNLTDVDDKTIRDSEEACVSLAAFTEKYTNFFFEDVKQLNILPAWKYPKATAHIKEMTALIAVLLKKGIAYRAEDGVYFDISKFKTYGKLSRVKDRSLKAGTRVAADEYDKNETHDFALWKLKSGNEPSWPAPFGEGRPGWHIECSAMSMKYLGNHFDIHCGGVDHIPVHHTNEIAQNEGAVGKQTVNLWMHGEFLNIDSARMGKSEGNFITLQTVIDKGIEPIAYRYLVLGTHYRQKLSFSWDSLNAAQNGLHNLLDATAALGKQTGRVAKKYQEQFITTINDDLNTPRALALAWEVLKDSTLTDADKRSALIDFDQIFGLGLETLESVVVPTDIKLMAEQRSMLRSEKKFSEADKIREEIEQRGFAVDDTADGFIIKKIRKS